MESLRGKQVEIVGTATVIDEGRVERQTIGGERRADRRYDICLDVQWKLVYRRRVVDSGFGRTRDLSSHGVLFEAGQRLAAGRRLELSISWPVLLHNSARLKLVASGRVVRSDGTRAAIRIVRREFYTAGVAPDRQKAASLEAGSPQQAYNLVNTDFSAGVFKN